MTLAELINLNRARKDRARAEKEAQAAANRARFGRTKAEKLKDTAEAARAEKVMDGHRRDRDDD